MVIIEIWTEYFEGTWEVLTGEHGRHKTIFCGAYILHEILKGISPESAGSLYLIIEILHSVAG